MCPAGVSILDKHRLWYQALGGPVPRCQHHRSLSFCGWTLLPNNPEVLVVEDTYADARCAHAICTPGIRADSDNVQTALCRELMLHMQALGRFQPSA